MKKLIILCLAFILVFSMAGCDQKIEKITDFERFESMTKETDKIEVNFDNNTGAPFYFTISDQAEIDAIMDIIFPSTVENAGKEAMAGDNTSLTIFQGENKYVIHFRTNKENKNFYNFTSRTLQDKIIELAREARAYDTKIGIAFQITEPLESPIEDKFFETQEGLFTYLKDNFSAYQYFYAFEYDDKIEPASNMILWKRTDRSFYGDIELPQNRWLVTYNIYKSYDNKYYIKADLPTTTNTESSMNFTLNSDILYTLTIRVKPIAD